MPLYTVAEAARVLQVSVSTFATWTKGSTRRHAGRPEASGRPIVTSLPAGGRAPTIPFVGLAEGMVLTAVRDANVPMQRIRPALAALDRELGIAHALASRRLYTDGAELLFDFATGERDLIGNLVVVRNGQRVFNDVVAGYLRRIEYAADGYARLIRVTSYRGDVVCDLSRSFGQPIFERGGVRVADVLERFQAGESLEGLTEEFGVPLADLEDALRVVSRRAA